METTQEQLVTWWAMETTSHKGFITEVHPLFQSRLTLHLSAAVEVIILGLAAKGVTPTYSPVLLLVDLMRMMTLLMKEITMSRQSQQPITMLLSLVF